MKAGQKYEENAKKTAKTTKKAKKTAANTNSAEMLVSENELLAAVAARFPSTREAFLKHGLHCIGCGAAYMETVRQGALSHGIDLQALLKDLNAAARKDSAKA